MTQSRIFPIGVASVDKGAMPPSNFWKMAILCFERRFSKQNSVIRLKSYTLPLQNFWAGYATDLPLPFKQTVIARIKLINRN